MNYLVSEPNYRTTIFFRKFISHRNEKRKKIFRNELVYIGRLILELSKIVMFEFWYDYVQPKYGEKAKLCYMNTDSFIAYIKNRTHTDKMLKQDFILQILN